MPVKGPLIHLFSACTALCLATIFIAASSAYRSQPVYTTRSIEGPHNRIRGVISDFSKGEDSELQVQASLKNPQQITLFGSSEFSDSPYCSYFFLPDTVGISTLGVGRAHHQSLSILCELMAASQDLEGAHLCIIVSPSWFETKGTNSQAFTDFVRPNFMKRIVADTSIPASYKQHVGSYIYHHQLEFSAISKPMGFLMDEYEIAQPFGYHALHGNLSRFLKTIYAASYSIENIVYKPTQFEPLAPQPWTPDQPLYLKQLQEKFLESITNNDLFISDTYYDRLIQEGAPERGRVKIPNLDANEELTDFSLLVQFLALRKADCSFVIQPLNPYYYENLSDHKPLIDSLTAIIQAHHFPCLNLFVYDQSSYEPGVLKDVMHLGDYGWMKINFFLDSLYHVY